MNSLRTISNRNQALGWGVVALFLRLLAAIWGFSRVPPTADGAFYHVVAQRILAGDGYTWLWPDGVVTYAAHYPVGYPTYMAGVYALFGASPGWVMVGNALLGSVAVCAAYWLAVVSTEQLTQESVGRSVRVALGLLLACSPTLIFYTPALMTEAFVGALLVCAAAIVQSLAGESPVVAKPLSRLLALAALGLLVGMATLVRPQSILFAPVLGLLCGRHVRDRIINMCGVAAVALAVVLPWTVRNCERMERCVFVSANGGWNLLIGTFEEGQGSWVELAGERVPVECREVYQEAEKDHCFGEAGKRRILAHPAQWLAILPAKLRAVFDYSAAAADYLRAAGAVDDSDKRAVQVLEFAHQRLVAVLCLLGAAALSARRGYASWLWGLGVLTGAVCFFGLAAWVGWGIVVGLAVIGRPDKLQPGWAFAVFSLLSTQLVYGVFFGAARYGIPLWFAVMPLAGMGLQLCGSYLNKWRAARGTPGR